MEMTLTLFHLRIHCLSTFPRRIDSTERWTSFQFGQRRTTFDWIEINVKCSKSLGKWKWTVSATLTVATDTNCYGNEHWHQTESWIGEKQRSMRCSSHAQFLHRLFIIAICLLSFTLSLSLCLCFFLFFISFAAIVYRSLSHTCSISVSFTRSLFHARQFCFCACRLSFSHSIYFCRCCWRWCAIALWYHSQTLGSAQTNESDKAKAEEKRFKSAQRTVTNLIFVVCAWLECVCVCIRPCTDCTESAGWQSAGRPACQHIPIIKFILGN